MLGRTPFLTDFATFIIVILVSALLQRTAEADSITLAWDESITTDVVGYVIHYGTNSGVYTQTLNVENQTTATLSGLEAGTYYCSVSALNTANVESLPSNEASFQVSASAPELVGITDGQALNSSGPVILQTVDFGADVARVEFYVGSAEVGQVTSSEESVSWQPPEAGDYTILVKSYDINGNPSSYTLNVHVVQPAVENPQWTVAGDFEITIKGAPGRMQHLYISENFQDWTLVASEVNTTGTMVFDDTGASQKQQRFYRVVSE